MAKAHQFGSTYLTEYHGARAIGEMIEIASDLWGLAFSSRQRPRFVCLCSQPCRVTLLI